MSLQVYGDKDQDGFYWGELRGRRGYVPHNMVTEMDEQGMAVVPPGGVGGGGGAAGIAGGGGITAGGGVGVVGGGATAGMQSVRGVSRDRWGDIYSNVPVKRMVALYDYDPQELSPNVDAEVSVILSIYIVYRMYFCWKFACPSWLSVNMSTFHSSLSLTHISTC